LTEDDFNQKSALTELAKTKVILYKGYINVLTEGLNPDLQILVEKDIPEFRTENTIPVVSGLTIRNGRLFFGSWYVEKGRGTLTDEQEQMMYESYAFYILDVAEEYSGLIPQPVQTTSYNFRISLPLVINNKSQQWDPWPILINVIDYCPEGQYVDVMDTRKGVDQNPDWDWWATQVRQQVIPGVVGCGDASWTSSRIHNRIAPQAMGVLFDYDSGRFESFVRFSANNCGSCMELAVFHPGCQRSRLFLVC
jgi:hypothetical protein